MFVLFCLFRVYSFIPETIWNAPSLVQCLDCIWQTLCSGHLLFSLLADGTRVKRGEEMGWRKEKDFPDHLLPLLSAHSSSYSAHPSLIFSPSSRSPLFQIVTKCKTQRETEKKRDWPFGNKMKLLVITGPRHILNIHHTINDKKSVSYFSAGRKKILYSSVALTFLSPNINCPTKIILRLAENEIQHQHSRPWEIYHRIFFFCSLHGIFLGAGYFLLDHSLWRPDTK